MGLTFLTPLFLLGLMALAVPVLVHLIQRDRKNVVPFPSLMFLERVPYRSVRRQTIRHWVLFLIRCGVIALLAAAFARPFLGRSVAGFGDGDGPREIVILLDRSYSMGYGDAFEQARSAARTTLSEAGEQDLVSLVAFAEGAETLRRSTPDLDQVRAVLDTLTVSDERTRYGPALKLAETVLGQSQLGRKEVVLISDFQQLAWTGDEDVSLPPGTVVTPVDVSGEGSNLALWDVSLDRSLAGARERVRAAARVVNLGSHELNAEVTLELDGRELQSTQLALGPAGTESSSGGVTFDPFTLTTENTTGRIRVGPDALASDNAFDFVISPESAPAVLVIEPANRGSPSLYLQQALEIGGDRGFRVRVVRSDRVGAGDIAGQSVIVVNGAPVSPAVVALLRSHLDAGGGLLVALEERSRWPDAALDLLPGPFGGPVDRSSGNRGAALGFIDYSHPVFTLFSTPRSGDFTTARFFRYRAVEPDTAAQVLARFDDGTPALVERRVGNGRVLLWTTGLDNFWNDLALQPVYLPYVHSMVQHLAGRERRAPWYTVGQVIDIGTLFDTDPTSVAESEDWVVLAPRGGASVVEASASGERYLRLSEAGVYEVRPDADGPGRRLAANADRAESALESLDPSELTAAVGAAADGSAGGTRSAEVALADREQRQSAWWYLMVLMFVLLVLDTAMSNRLSRRPA